MGTVIKKSDAWIEIPAVTEHGFDEGPIQLRPGSDESKVTIKIVGAFAHEVSIKDLELGIDLVKEEHAR